MDGCDGVARQAGLVLGAVRRGVGGTPGRQGQQGEEEDEDREDGVWVGGPIRPSQVCVLLVSPSVSPCVAPLSPRLSPRLRVCRNPQSSCSRSTLFPSSGECRAQPRWQTHLSPFSSVISRLLPLTLSTSPPVQYHRLVYGQGSGLCAISPSAGMFDSLVVRALAARPDRKVLCLGPVLAVLRAQEDDARAVDLICRGAKVGLLRFVLLGSVLGHTFSRVQVGSRLASLFSPFRAL